MSDDEQEQQPDDGKVLMFPVKFAGTPEDKAPQMRDEDDLHDGRCRHMRTTFSRKKRTIECDDCQVPVDVYEVLAEVVKWVARHRWEWDEMERRSRDASAASEVKLTRVKKSERSGALIVHRCHVAGIHQAQRIPTEAIQLGDYMSMNMRYRVRAEDGKVLANAKSTVWTVVFWDAEHGLKPLTTLTRPTLAQVKTAVRDHWMRLARNAPKARTG